VILLSKVEAFRLLVQIPDRLVVSRGVLSEVASAGPGDPGTKALMETSAYQLVDVQAVHPNVAGWDLGRGESEVLSWTMAHRGAVAVLDDRQARAAARNLGVRTIGALGVVVRAKRAGRVASAAVLLERLLGAGLWLSAALVEEAVRLAGEEPRVQ